MKTAWLGSHPARTATLATILIASPIAWWRFGEDRSDGAVSGSDQAWYDQQAYLRDFDRSYQPARTSQYVTMSDGTRLALTVFLPNDLASGQTVPTVLQQTRYWRESSEGVGGGLIFSQLGYAFVSVDARGTGASFGTRRYTLGPEETADGKEIMDWVARQPWSNGKIGTIGGSYTGATALKALAVADSSLVAVIPAAIGHDMFTQAFFPGGVYQARFLSIWQSFGMTLDNDKKDLGQLPGLVPVDSDADSAELRKAVADHQGNFKIHDVLSMLTFRDQVTTDAFGDEMTVDDVSLHNDDERIEKSSAAMLELSGWFDGALFLGAIERFCRFPNRAHKLVLGPWEHHGLNVSPWKTSEAPGFNRAAHYIRFLNTYLQGTSDAAALDAPVMYFTMGEEKWKAADTWPPAGTEWQTLYLGANRTLVPRPPTQTAGDEVYQVDFSTNTGLDNRYYSIVNFDGQNIGYHDRASQQDKLLTFTGSPNEQDVEVTGSVRVTLYVASTATDGAFHVYLEDVGPDGRIRYVTEGVLRASQRKISTPPHPSYPFIYRTHRQADFSPLVPGEVAELVIELLPTSYQFRRQHSLRIGIAGADSTMFARIPSEGPAPTLHVQRNSLHPSKVELPIMSRTGRGAPVRTEGRCRGSA